MNLLICPGSDKSALDESLTGHPWHCPACDRHLTSLLLCPECGVRFELPPDQARDRQLARLLVDTMPERVLQLAAELATSRSY